MDKNEYLEDRDYYDSALADPSFFPQGTTLCHADLFPRHILVGPGETGITGVLDWEDACLTDPATNLALLPTDAGFAQSILDAWRPGDDGLWRRSRVMAHLDFGEMVRDMIEVGKQVLDPGLLHRYHTTRRCDGR
jgi:aminoglycoside phosphotransferase (APT) family kinase protein